MKQGENMVAPFYPKDGESEKVCFMSALPRRPKIQVFISLMLDKWFAKTFSQVFAFTLVIRVTCKIMYKSIFLLSPICRAVASKVLLYDSRGETLVDHSFGYLQYRTLAIKHVFELRCVGYYDYENCKL